jgi:UDPglucose 6-dehydrogenase
VVIGVEAEDPRAAAFMRELYGPFTRTGAPIMVMDTASAELSKYAANAILATRISFMNEIANVCELVGADVDQVRKAIGSDRRIGPSFLFPGMGYGGSCFPDTKALLKSCRTRATTEILRAVRSRRRSAEVAPVREMESHFTSLKGRTIAMGSGVQAADRHARGARFDDRAIAGGRRDRARPTEAGETARRVQQRIGVGRATTR